MKRLYVGNIPWTATEQEFTERFAVHGNIESVHWITDSLTGKFRGFAFVEYTTDVSAQRALQHENRSFMDGRTLRVVEASPHVSRKDEPNGSKHNLPYINKKRIRTHKNIKHVL